MISNIDLIIKKLTLKLGLDNDLQPEEVNYSIEDKVQTWSEFVTTLYVGDNLSYLKGLSHYSKESIDLCYIDPPYNTGSNFIYNDTRKSKSNGIFGTHSSWMSFMLPRLIYAKELLKQSGIIAVSVDDYEQAYLKFLMDKIFGEDNFIGSIIVCRSKNGKGSRNNLATNHEYLLIYGKSKQSKLRGQIDETTYDKLDEFGQYRVDGLFRKKGAASSRVDRPNMFYPLFYNPKNGKVSVDPIPGWLSTTPVDSKGIERRWLWGVDTAKEREWRLYASKNGVIYVKNYAGDSINIKRTKVRTIWEDTSFYTEQATKEIKELFGSKIFDTPKPMSYIKKIIDICSNDEAVILDFFAGSGTTAHAVAELNQIDNGNRRCILMETDCDIPLKHSARKYGYKKISDITLERLKIIQNEHKSFEFQVINSGI